MSSSQRHLEWRNFRTLIDEGIPAIQPVTGSPAVQVFVDEGGGRVGLRTPVSPGTDTPVSPLAGVTVRKVEGPGGEAMLEVSTRARGLFVEFYALLEDLADRIQLGGMLAGTAFLATIANWKDLLRPIERLSEERQLGLWGELWLLQRLSRALGAAAAVAAWTGPIQEPHDFRLAVTEIEVKATRSRRRSHIISSIDQLEPSPGHQLSLLSLHLEPGGAGGTTLPEMVAAVRALCSGDPATADTLEQRLLIGSKYVDSDAPAYADRFSLRAPPRLIAVNAALPRITRSILDAELGPDAHRIDDVQYRLDVAGLGDEDGSRAFLAVIPPALGVAP